MIARVLLFTIGAFVSVAAAAGPELRKPTGKWIVSFDDAQCVATRNYGSDEDPIYLVLKAPPLGDVLQIGLVRKGYTSAATQMDGEIVFDSYPPIRTNLLEFGVKKLNQRAVLVNLPLRDIEPMRQASSIRIRARDELQVLGSRIGRVTRSTDQRFALSQITQLLKTLDACAADLRKAWNIADPGAGTPLLKEEAAGNLMSIFNPDDYPGVAVLKGQSGGVHLALLVTEQGRVADCTVIETSGIASLDAQSCAIVKERARLKPAIGLDGKPARGSYLQRIRWKLIN